jgi:DeoR/GlpR family transcriptional regulator of sugar metabolism
MFAEERRAVILNMVNQEGRVTAKDLADQFQLSVDSIRRDLTIMEEQGLLKKTHGGAIPIGPVRQIPVPRSVRYGEGTPHEQAIAKLAASYILEGHTISLGSAAIHYYMVRYLPSFPFTVITNSLTIAHALLERENVETYILGGKVKPSGNVTDALANEFIRQFSIDLCFLTGGGVSVNGISTTTPEVALIARTTSQIAKRTILLAPHPKLGTDAFVRSGPLHNVELLITDEETSEEAINAFKQAGITVQVAAVEW